MSVSCIQNAKLEETGFSYTMSLIQGNTSRRCDRTTESKGSTGVGSEGEWDCRQSQGGCADGNGVQVSMERAAVQWMAAFRLISSL